jgi:membrane protein YqaA with SNARE-associated domain
MDWLRWITQPEASLAGLFLSSFLSATVLPGGSEAVLFAVVRLHPEQTAPALLLATLGNTLGGMATYLMSWWLPQKYLQRIPSRRIEQARRWGPAAMILAWTPFLGDALCAAAGWLRLPALACALWMALGKGARYAAVLWLAGN